jgi:hypothetical protein
MLKATSILFLPVNARFCKIGGEDLLMVLVDEVMAVKHTGAYQHDG